MSYASSPNTPPAGNPPSVQDPQWRLRHSAWLLAPILGLGIFGCIGFVYIAARTRSRRLWKIAAVYCAVSLVLGISLTVFPASSRMNSVNGLVLLALWLGGTIHGIFLNREYLRWRATSRPWYASGTVPTPTAVSFAPQQPAGPPQPLGIDPQQYFAPTAPPSPSPTSNSSVANPGRTPDLQATGTTQTTDVNRADEAALARVPGLDSEWARHIVAVRSNRNGFSSLADFTDAVGIQPHHLMRVRDHITFGPVRAPGAHSPSRPTRGRIVDI